MFSHTWILGDEIGRVSCSCVSLLGRTVVYVVPGLCRRRESHSSAAQHGDTQGPQVVHKLRRRPNFAKLLRIRPLTPNAHRYLFHPRRNFYCGLLSPGSSWTTGARSVVEKGRLKHEQFLVVSLLLQFGLIRYTKTVNCYCFPPYPRYNLFCKNATAKRRWWG